MISARALCFDMKPNLCLLRLSSTQHNAPEFHDTREIEFKARGGPALLGMPKLYEEPCGNTLVPSSHSNCHKAYVSGSSGARKEVLCPLHQRKTDIYTKDAPSPRQWDYGRHLFSCPLHHHHCRRAPSEEEGHALWFRDPPPACPIRHTPAIIPERAPITYYFQTRTPQAERHMLPDAKLAATSRPKGHWTRTSAPNLEPHAQYCTPLLYDISYTVDAYANIYTYERS